MASNSLKGGKNIYGPETLQGNWFEERAEPQHIEGAQLRSTELPSKTAKTWKVTSGDYGGHTGAPDKTYVSTETSNWMKYQKDDASRYQTTSGGTYVAPMHQTSPFKEPTIPDALVEDYRQTWTKSDPAQFHRSTIGHQ